MLFLIVGTNLYAAGLQTAVGDETNMLYIDENGEVVKGAIPSYSVLANGGSNMTVAQDANLTITHHDGGNNSLIATFGSDSLTSESTVDASAKDTAGLVSKGGMACALNAWVGSELIVEGSGGLIRGYSAANTVAGAASTAYGHSMWLNATDDFLASAFVSALLSSPAPRPTRP